MLKNEVRYDNMRMIYSLYGLTHRENGPAFISQNGYGVWYQYGYRHRKNGPARIYPSSGRKEYWNRGRLC